MIGAKHARRTSCHVHRMVTPVDRGIINLDVSGGTFYAAAMLRDS